MTVNMKETRRTMVRALMYLKCVTNLYGDKIMGHVGRASKDTPSHPFTIFFNLLSLKLWPLLHVFHVIPITDSSEHPHSSLSSPQHSVPTCLRFLSFLLFFLFLFTSHEIIFKYQKAMNGMRLK